MPASGNAAWNPDDPITAAKLQNIENAVARSVDKGSSSTSTDQVLAFLIPTDTRSWTATAWNGNGKPTHIDVKSGATTVAAIDITYNGDDNPTQVTAVAGGKTITWTVTWDGAKFTNYTKAVV